MISLYAYHIYNFFCNIFEHHNQDSAIHMGIHVHAPIRLHRCISAVPRQNLAWEWLVQIMIRQVICADFFLQHFRASRQRYSCIPAYMCMPRSGCADEFRPVSPEPVLGMIELPQFMQTMIRQVICANLSAFSRLMTTAISAAETKWWRLLGRKVTFWPFVDCR